ncbi:hypothetical protein B0H16DRAFT_1470914 [Mycena metata]|uniref:Uncharacterized protein n=1 Tax=Mycena metata TaxID=1033252 RepID=A0AAD7MPY0_9AGAR|nr:hypothetical protein B0H16DRAFT_1470914 [Mycena metata]
MRFPIAPTRPFHPDGPSQTSAASRCAPLQVASPPIYARQAHTARARARPRRHPQRQIPLEDLLALVLVPAHVHRRARKHSIQFTSPPHPPPPPDMRTNTPSPHTVLVSRAGDHRDVHRARMRLRLAPPHSSTVSPTQKELEKETSTPKKTTLKTRKTRLTYSTNTSSPRSPAPAPPPPSYAEPVLVIVDGCKKGEGEEGRRGKNAMVGYRASVGAGAAYCCGISLGGRERTRSSRGRNWAVSPHNGPPPSSRRPHARGRKRKWKPPLKHSSARPPTWHVSVHRGDTHTYRALTHACTPRVGKDTALGREERARESATPYTQRGPQYGLRRGLYALRDGAQRTTRGCTTVSRSQHRQSLRAPHTAKTPPSAHTNPCQNQNEANSLTPSSLPLPACAGPPIQRNVVLRAGRGRGGRRREREQREWEDGKEGWGGKREEKQGGNEERKSTTQGWRGRVARVCTCKKEVIMKAKTERVEVANRKPTRGCAREIGRRGGAEGVVGCTAREGEGASGKSMRGDGKKDTRKKVAKRLTINEMIPRGAAPFAGSLDDAAEDERLDEQAEGVHGLAFFVVVWSEVVIQRGLIGAVWWLFDEVSRKMADIRNSQALPANCRNYVAIGPGPVFSPFAVSAHLRDADTSPFPLIALDWRHNESGWVTSAFNYLASIFFSHAISLESLSHQGCAENLNVTLDRVPFRLPHIVLQAELSSDRNHQHHPHVRAQELEGEKDFVSARPKTLSYLALSPTLTLPHNVIESGIWHSLWDFFWHRISFKSLSCKGRPAGRYRDESPTAFAHAHIFHNINFRRQF